MFSVEYLLHCYLVLGMSPHVKRERNPRDLTGKGIFLFVLKIPRNYNGYFNPLNELLLNNRCIYVCSWAQTEITDNFHV